MRFYTIGDRRYPSVTTVLSQTMPTMARYQLDAWYAKGPDNFRHNEAGRMRGNLSDLWIKNYLRSLPLPEVDYWILQLLKQSVSVLDDLKMNTGLLCDQLLVNEDHGYAGTADVLVQREGSWCVWEFKTKGKRLTPEQEIRAIQFPDKSINPHAEESALLQCAAYVSAARSQGMIVSTGCVCFLLQAGLVLYELAGDRLEDLITQFHTRVASFGVSA